MLLTKFIIIKMNRGNLGYYNRVMGTKFKVGEEVEIPIEFIPKSMSINVDVGCDVCSKQSVTTYRNYNDCLGYGFYTCNNCKHIKRKLTNKEKYGVDDFNNIEKRKKTMILKYGSYNNNREKSKKTCLRKYGKDNVSGVDFVKNLKKETNLKNWGVENVFQSEEIKRISKITMVNKFGVEHANQNSNIFIKSQLSGFKIKVYNGIYYRGTYELDFLKFCETNKLDVTNGPSIKFKFNKKNKIYFSDFYLPKYNLICEIKSDYTYNANKEINDIKKIEVELQGYLFLFIIDKDYTELLRIVR